jgi:hypothetical protein
VLNVDDEAAHPLQLSSSSSSSSALLPSRRPSHGYGDGCLERDVLGLVLVATLFHPALASSLLPSLPFSLSLPLSLSLRLEGRAVFR